MAADETLIVDCTTGERTQRVFSPAEAAQRTTDQAESQRLHDEDQASAQRREQSLEKIADAAGITIDELKNVLPHQGSA